MIAIIADDLTGANDTGVQYVKNGYTTRVKILNDNTVTGQIFDSDVVVINTDTRPMPSQEAYDKVYALAKQLGELPQLEYIYKKVDSLMRGNPAPELEAILDATGASVAFVASAFPENGRIVTDGTLMMPDGKQVDITNIFNTETSKKAIGVRLSIIREGVDRLAAFLTEQMAKGASIFVFDTVDNKDLALISDAAMLVKSDKKVFCGSAGLAKQLGRKKKACVKYEGTTFVVVGSRSATTAHQVRMMKETFHCPVVVVNSKEIIEGQYEKAVNDAVQKSTCLYDSGKKLVVIAIDSLFEEYTLVLRESAENAEKSLLVAESLGDIVKRLFDHIKPVTFVATGGDTAFQLCHALGSAGMELTDEIVPGVPIGILKEGMADGCSMVTKSGGFGEEDTLVKVIHYLHVNAK